jgi:hypothetical protein
MDLPIPELAPVTIAFWPFSNLRFSVFGTIGFGKSIKLFSEYGTLGLGRLAASGGIVGIVFPSVLRIRRNDRQFLTAGAVVCAVLSAFRRQHLGARKDLLYGATNRYEQRERLRFHHHRFGRGWRHFGVSPCAEWEENSVN